MTARKPLRVVKESDGSAEKSKTAPKSVKEAADTGERRALLVAMRSRISTEIDNVNTPARDLAALSRRLLEIAKEIESIEARAKDEAAEDRAAPTDEAFDASAI